MAEDCSFFNKDPIIKPVKKSPAMLRMIMLVIVMISCIYICIFSLRQTHMPSNPQLMKIKLTEQHVHYPEPTTFRRNECACTPVRFFAILTMQRSGSGWFETLLNSHINISSNGEIFSAIERRSNISAIMRTLDKVYSLDWISSASKNECTAAVGFKWMLNQGLMEHHKEIAEYFKYRRVYAIFLFRRNLLRRMVSLLANDHDRDAKQLNGTHKAHVHSRNEADILAKYKPTINATMLIPNLRLMDKASADAMEFFKSTCHILLYYEDLVKNHKKLRDVQKFLGVPRRRLVSRHVKIHTRPLPEQVQNWDAIYRTLRGTPYQSFLSADY